MTAPKEHGAETILLVEDESGLRNLVSKVLSAKGYRVIETRHGQQALEESERHAGRIDLLLTDVVLPKMSGRELAGHLKAKHPEARVLGICPECAKKYFPGFTDGSTEQHL